MRASRLAPVAAFVMRVVMAVVIAAGVVAGGPVRPAAAQGAGLRKVAQLNRAAMEDYDLLEFERARARLHEALVVIKRARLEKHPIAARTHLNLGIVYGGGLKDGAGALLEFGDAISVDPTLRLPAAYKSPRLQKLFDQARDTVTGGRGVTEPRPGAPVVTTPTGAGPREPGPLGAPEGPGAAAAVAVAAEPPTPEVEEPSPGGMLHGVPEQVAPGQPVPVVVRVGSRLKARKVVLYFRTVSGTSFTPVPMPKVGPRRWEAHVPADETGDGVEGVEYYVEVRGRRARILARIGDASSPNEVLVVAPPPPPAPEPPPETTDDLAGRAEEVVPAVAERRPPADDDDGRFFLGVAVGTGGGYVSGRTEASKQEVACCVAHAPLHVTPELGVRLTGELALSLVGRIGFPLGADVEGKATAAPAGFIRLGWTPGWGGLFLHGDVGAGFIRHTIKLEASSSSATMGDTDTYATGPLLVGGGAGWGVPVGGGFRLVADLNLEVGIPIVDEVDLGGGEPVRPGFAVNADLNLGVALAF